ncbi:hypothetical protein CLV84_2044 [Neolewinella xylanilytica]|uniref:Secreted protein n=1 Tax=Neolewinella xylanilytica TaxID=1514080 RepID=A0A2S6I1V0_9BACT|nr:hypothetical protein [Neolewinella xylanilytica]PPK85152.1 hypothetical protein CLV84_2044 [Neolewinella xylanilytica]
MTTLRCLLFFALCGFFTSGAQAQDFGSALGVRLGSPLSVSYKNFLSRTSALEVYAGIRNYGEYGWFSINGAYQVHTDIAQVYGLQWYYGGGAGLQFWNYDRTVENSVTLGLSGYLGLQYTFYGAPVTLSLDWVPTLFVGRKLDDDIRAFGAGHGALAVRYILFR